MKKHTPEEIKIIDDLQDRRDAALGKAYDQYKSYFIGWAAKQFSGIGDERIEDVYQNALIVFIEKFIWGGRIGVKDGEVFGLTASIGSFITTIGRNMLINEVRKNKKYPVSSLEPHHEHLENDPGFDNDILKEKNERVAQAFEMLKEKEKEVVYFKYVLGYSYEQIREVMDMASADSLKTLCARYMKKFRTNYQALENKEKKSGSGK